MVHLPAGGDPAGLFRAVRRRPRKKLEAVARALIGKGPRTGGQDQDDEEPDLTVSAADFLRDGGNPEKAVELIEVLQENWQAVMVFRQCRAHWVTGMHAPIYDGITAMELEAAARLHRIAPSAYDDLVACIAVLVQTTRQARNEATT
ncbi:DUF1799 domain-containing protein [Xanthomonas nasturtii]|uniref:DUF1799 domain-containing protein n=1 Tax=Xanthomonas nasturtii TaxID=1843581 RepID=A0ABT0LM71_9XANT|nr:DUF1799 domain-containing protein [Xanthomonas nasturtii]MCL1550458.1 DUF1799 domain-containing protein [Xanthomonas nasturtii]MCL1554752.1 DUF1799 domain-containing protein [Xanthomonas nasturtii]MCL1561316.1 DUF1799 domain-containing protein [Xanthomonas nasturtii]